MSTDRKFWVMLLIAAIGVGGLVGLSYAEVKKGDIDMELAFGGNFDFGNGTTGVVSLDSLTESILSNAPSKRKANAAAAKDAYDLVEVTS